MRLMTISQLTHWYGVSLRTLRYYEQIGLIESVRGDDYAYRTYDERNCSRVGQIVLLRKLRIPLKQIGELLANDDVLYAVELFRRTVWDLSEEIDSLETIRAILTELIERLNRVQGMKPLEPREHFLTDGSLSALIESMAVDPKKELVKIEKKSEKKNEKKEEHTMSDLNKAAKNLGKLTDVRILYLPPATVAASHFIGDDPEDVAGKLLDEFARSVNITEIKPDVRMYGFNHPNPKDATNAHGYEFWLTIPDDMDVLAPLQKKHFEGGLYVAHMIQMGNFHEWAWLSNWLDASDEYVYNGHGSPENMFDSLEEHLNAYTYLRESVNKDANKDASFTQLDLLIPVRRK